MMRPTRSIRLATPSDAADCLEIYRSIIEGTPITFETEVPTEVEFARRIAEGMETHPWLVCELSGDFAGYAYASVHRERIAYQWCAEVSAYVDPRYHRQGVGRIMYGKLFECLRYLGYQNAFAGATLPNEASVHLHESMGFESVGVFKRIGYKMGAWHDVGWWGLRLSDDDSPSPPTPLRDAREQIAALLRKE